MSSFSEGQPNRRGDHAGPEAAGRGQCGRGGDSDLGVCSVLARDNNKKMASVKVDSRFEVSYVMGYGLIGLKTTD